MEAGVVRRFRARVSWSITASMSYGSNKDMKIASLTEQKTGVRPILSSALSGTGRGRHEEKEDRPY